MNACLNYMRSSIGKKQIVATTGLLLILFLIGHLGGNLLIFLGPEAFNKYAHKLAGLRPGLYVVEAGLLYIFLVHIWFTAQIVWQNIQSRPVQYHSTKPKAKRSFATRIMPYTGTLVLAFVIYHLLDFTFIEKNGPRSYINGEDYDIFGVVYNSFLDPIHSLLYIFCLMALSFHLGHGIQSFAQTFGFNSPEITPLIKKISNCISILICGSYCLIPIAILLQWIKL